MSSVKTSILWKTMILKMKIQAIDWENKSHTMPRNDSHYIKKPQKPYFQKKKKQVKDLDILLLSRYMDGKEMKL